MIRTLRIAAILSFFAPSMLVSAEPADQAAAGTQQALQFTAPPVPPKSYRYLLFKPRDYHTDPQSKWPLILFLHGAGERGDDVWKVATHGPPKIAGEQPDFPFIVVSPQCPEGEIWDPTTLGALLDEIERAHRVDRTRVYLTGLSMGGYGTWNLAMRQPERFAAVAPICGGGQLIDVLATSGRNPQALRSLPVRAHHGARDNVVPPAESERMVNALKNAGATNVSLTIHPDDGHDSWSRVYSDPEFYQWLLGHRRANR